MAHNYNLWSRHWKKKENYEHVSEQILEFGAKHMTNSSVSLLHLLEVKSLSKNLWFQRYNALEKSRGKYKIFAASYMNLIHCFKRRNFP